MKESAYQLNPAEAWKLYITRARDSAYGFALSRRREIVARPLSARSDSDAAASGLRTRHMADRRLAAFPLISRLPRGAHLPFRSRSIAGTKKRWAAIRAAKAAAAVPVPAATAPKTAPAKARVPVKKEGLTDAGRKALSIAMKKRWAAKKKAAAKGKAA